MKILSIETSCDETGISILEVTNKKNPRLLSPERSNGEQATFKVLSNFLNSQIKIHAPYGGVFPMLAKREHQKNLPILLEKALKQAKLRTSSCRSRATGSHPSPSPDRRGLGRGESPVDLIAVTSGPGLEPALWTGIVFARELSQKWKVPVIPVNHMEGHILSVFGMEKGKFKISKIKFPVLSLLVSGGHTELVLIKNWRKYNIIGETLDDAAGEAFDKVARMLELPYPGGPEISRLAKEGRKNLSPLLNKEGVGGGNSKNHHLALRQAQGTPPQEGGEKIKLPRPMMYSKNFDFSFSGLKTAVLYLIRDLKKENPNILKNEKIKQTIACEFENAVIETLVHKTKKAIEKYNIQTLIVAGGVSANKYLKKELKKIINKKQKLLFPGKKLSTDNSIMIGIAGYFKFLEKKQKGTQLNKIKAEGGLRL